MVSRGCGHHEGGAGEAVALHVLRRQAQAHLSQVEELEDVRKSVLVRGDKKGVANKVGKFL